MSLTLNCLFLIITIVFFVKGELNRSISTCSAPLCPRKQNTNSSCSSTNTQICHAYTIALTNQVFCAPSFSCSSFDPCLANLTCSTNTSVCLAETCCLKPVCIPITLSLAACSESTLHPTNITNLTSTTTVKTTTRKATTNRLCSSNISITFGSGTSEFTNETFGIQTNYQQIIGRLVFDGEFAFVNRVPEHYNWHSGALDHTEGDINGYMFLCGGAYNPGQVFNYTFQNLCAETRYEFSIYATSIGKASIPNHTEPSFTFEILTTTNHSLLASLNTGMMSDYDEMTWSKYSMLFTTQSTSAILVVKSNVPGGFGNDFAIDDIQLRVY